MESKTIKLFADIFWGGWMSTFIFMIFWNAALNHRFSPVSIVMFLVGSGWVFYSHSKFDTSMGSHEKLVTSGPYRFTRHPIYTGFVIADLSYWITLPPLTDWVFYLCQILFFVCIIACAYFEEQDILSDFGDEAKDYYAKTPRLFFMYPFMSHG